MIIERKEGTVSNISELTTPNTKGLEFCADYF